MALEVHSEADFPSGGVYIAGDSLEQVREVAKAEREDGRIRIFSAEPTHFLSADGKVTARFEGVMGKWQPEVGLDGVVWVDYRRRLYGTSYDSPGRRF